MVRYVQCIAVLLLICISQLCLAEEPSLASATKKIRTEIFKLVKQIKEGIDYVIENTSDVPISDGSVHKSPSDTIEKDVTNQLKYLSNIKADDLQNYMLNTESIIVNVIVEQVPDIIQLNERLSEIFINHIHIDKKYTKFLDYHEHPEKYDKDIIKRFANTALNDEGGVKNLLENAHSLLVLGGMSSFSTVQLLNENIESFLQYTKISITPQQYLFDILKTTLCAELKGYFILKYSYKILQVLDKWGNIDNDLETIERDFDQRTNKTLQVFKVVVARASRELSKYNPHEHKEDVTYAKLKHVFQEFIINEYDVKPSDGCRNSCSDYRIPDEKAKNNCYYQNEICSIRNCNGYLHDCRKKIDTTMQVCFSRLHSDRKYEFIDFANGAGHYGYETGKCWADPIETAASHLYILWSCESCMCVCADTSRKAHRFFSLNPSMANIVENYVVTGARLVKRNRVIHIQIQEGQLLLNGQINGSTIRWVPINEDPNNHTLTWEDGREVNLDDLHAPENSVLTGLSFVTVMADNFQRRLHLKIYSTPLYYESGSLDIRSLTERINEPAKDEIDLRDVDIPTRTSVQIAEKSKPDSFVKFGPSGLEQDAGQNTIPFIDLQEVTTISHAPMSGAGIYLKKRDNNGGFLALKLFSYDYVQLIE